MKQAPHSFNPCIAVVDPTLFLNSINNFHWLIFSCLHSASWEWGGRSLTKISYDHVVENVKLAAKSKVHKEGTKFEHARGKLRNKYVYKLFPCTILWLKY